MRQEALLPLPVAAARAPAGARGEPAPRLQVGAAGGGAAQEPRARAGAGRRGGPPAPSQRAPQGRLRPSPATRRSSTRRLALFVRYMLAVTPPLPDSDQEPARLTGRKRYDVFLAEVGKRVAGNGVHTAEVLRTVPVDQPDLFATALGSGPPRSQLSTSALPRQRPGRPEPPKEGRRPCLISSRMPRAQEAQGRRRQMLRTAFGPAIAAALADPAVIEVMANPDGKLWIEFGPGRPPRQRRAHRRGRGRAHHPPRCRARAPRGHRQGADRLGRAARDRRALRGRDAAGGAGALLLDPQAGAGALPALTTTWRRAS